MGSQLRGPCHMAMAQVTSAAWAGSSTPHAQQMAIMQNGWAGQAVYLSCMGRRSCSPVVKDTHGECVVCMGKPFCSSCSTNICDMCSMAVMQTTSAAPFSLCVVHSMTRPERNSARSAAWPSAFTQPACALLPYHRLRQMQGQGRNRQTCVHASFACKGLQLCGSCP